MKFGIIFYIIFLSLLLNLSFASDWPREMGTAGTGITDEKISESAVKNNTGPKVLWRKSVGIGCSTPIVVAGMVYVVGGFEAGKEPVAENTPDKLPQNWDKINYKELDIYLTCIDAKDGKVQWQSKVVTNEKINHQAGIYSSPLYFKGNIFLRTTKTFVAVNEKNGETVWKIDLEEKFKFPLPNSEIFKTKVGGSAFMCGRGSPISFEDKIIISYFAGKEATYGGENSYVQIQAGCAAIEPETGKVIWSKTVSPYTRIFDTKNNTSESGYPSWEPPLSAGKIDGKSTVVMSTGHAVIGLDSTDGKTLWTFNHAQELDSIKKFINNQDESEANPWPWWVGYGYVPPQVLVKDNIIIDRLFCGHGTFGTLTYAFEIKDGKFNILWQTDDLATRNAKYVLCDNKLYGIDLYSHLHTVDFANGKIAEWPRPPRPDDVKQFQCRDITTGKILWSSDELYQGQKTASTDFNCEQKNTKGHLDPCPALNNETRLKIDEGGYSYPGDPSFIIAGDTLVFKAARQTMNGLYFAKIADDGLKKIGGKSFWLGEYYWGEPVVADGKCFLKLDNERNDFSTGTSGNLICFDIH